MLNGRKILSALLCTVLTFAQTAALTYAAEPSGTEIYVDAEEGNDSGAGTRTSPYKTIEKAQDAVRRRTASMSNDITVYLMGGTYDASSGISFDERDSGRNGYKVIWRAYGEETPVISGGKNIDGWTLYDAEKNIWMANAKGIETRQLTVNGVSAVRARSDGNILSEDAVYDDGVTGYTCSNSELLSWRNQSNIEFVYKNEWTNSRCAVQSISENEDGKTVIRMKQPGWRNVRVVKSDKLRVTFPWYVENAFELLDEAGEFYLDLTENKFYYIPRSGENMENAEVIANIAETVLSVHGSDLDNFVRNIEFDGLTFRHTTWLKPGHDWGYADNQNATIRDFEYGVRDLFAPGMVDVTRAESVNFKNCEFSYSGSIGLKMTEGIKSCDVVGNHFYNCAGHGIVMGDITCQDKDNYRFNPADSRLFIVNCKVNNNYIHNIGTEFKSSAAVSLGFMIDSEACHNEIDSVPYSGFHICYGFQTYTYDEGTVFRNVKILNNFVQNVMNDDIFDGGSIYVLGSGAVDAGFTAEISGNYIKDQNDVYSCIYLDNGSTHNNVHDNVIDQYSYPKGHSGDGRLYWTFSNTESHGNRVYNSYINIPDNSRIHDKATDVEIEAAHVFLDNKWPQAALDIIDNAGLQPEYRKKLGGIKRDALDKIVTESKLKLKSGESANPEINAFSVDGRIISEAELDFAVEDGSVAQVSSDGVFRALASGRTTVMVTASYDGVTKQKEIEVFVDDKPAEISLENVPKNLFEGNKFKLNATFATLYNDDTVENAQISFSTSNPQIMTVDSEDFLIGIGSGEAVLYVTATVEGESFTSEFPVTVHKSGSYRNMNYSTVPADSLIKDASKWTTTGTNDESERITLGEGTAKFKTPGSGTNGYGIYKGEKFLNEVIDFDYKYNSISGYVMFALRVQGENEGPLSKVDGSGCYLVVVKPTSIELQRVINGKSYMLYGKLTGNSALGGERDNKLMPHSETLNLQFGAVNYKDSVVLSLTADGQTVFEWFDDSPDAIKNAGHFGVVVRSGSLDISTPTESAERMEKAKQRVDGTAYFRDTLTHWAINDIAWLSGKKIFTGYEDGLFRPDAYITRAEMCEVLKKCFDFESRVYNGEAKDISLDDWYADTVATVLGAQVVPSEMLSGGNFLPNRSITREETAALIYNLVLGFDGIAMEQGDLAAFGDGADAADWAKTAVAGMVGEGLICGDDNTMLNPKAPITRAEIAVILRRLMDR